MNRLAQIPLHKHVLIAGPTASGKSALALELAQDQGGVIVNADAIQVFANWRILTARPDESDLAAAPHRLYGHIAHDQNYSTGQWLREVKALRDSGERLIVIGGTGLYLSALTEGLADIPLTPDSLRAKADAIRLDKGHQALADELDEATLARIDLANPMRVQRAWEVLRNTGRGLASWQDETPPPLLAPEDCATVLFDAPKEWLNARIEGRFAKMLVGGVLDEARANLDHWDPAHPSAKAIGAADIIAHLRGQVSLEEARERIVIATRQFAKRQRTWFRARMRHWTHYRPETA